jgi:release factor glutamine methyltransferase
LKSSKILLRYISDALNIYEKREAEAIAFMLIEALFDLSRSKVLSDYPLANIPLKTIDEMIYRLKQWEPIQYVLGYTYFSGRKFKVDKNVLIPRPETEELTALILQDHKNKPNLRIIDFCTGSGCIAITLEKEFNSPVVTATDLSEDALCIARENAKTLNSNTFFIKNDLLNDWFADENSFDIIVSNPPYVLESEADKMAKNVLDHEPAMALFVPDHDPLLFYKAIVSKASKLLSDKGSCYLEINEKTGKEIETLFKEYHFNRVIIKQDLSGRVRFALGIK